MIPIVVGLIHLSRSPDYPGFNNADQTFSVVIAEMVRSGDAFQYLTSCTSTSPSPPLRSHRSLGLMLTVSLAAMYVCTPDFCLVYLSLLVV